MKGQIAVKVCINEHCQMVMPVAVKWCRFCNSEQAYSLRQRKATPEEFYYATTRKPK